MRIYSTGFRAFSVPETHVFVTPGRHPEADPAEWHEGGKPVMFDIVLRYGVAEVPEPLGKFMVANGMASPSRFLIGQKVA